MKKEHGARRNEAARRGHKGRTTMNYAAIYLYKGKPYAQLHPEDTEVDVAELYLNGARWAVSQILEIGV